MKSPLYIRVQMTVHVSLSGLPVLTILYMLILLHKRTKSQNCGFLVFFKKLQLKKKLFFTFSKLLVNSIKKGDLLVKSKINLSVQGGTFYLHPYFETYRVKTLSLNQGFPKIRQTFKYLLFSFVVFLTIGRV